MIRERKSTVGEEPLRVCKFFCYIFDFELSLMKTPCLEEMDRKMPERSGAQWAIDLGVSLYPNGWRQKGKCAH